MMNWQHIHGGGIDYATSETSPGEGWSRCSTIPEPQQLDVPVGEVDTLIRMMPTIGWEILARMGIE